MRRRRQTLPAELRTELERVTPSVNQRGFEYRPCEVSLNNGGILSRVYLESATPWFEEWGVDPEDDPGKSGISMADVKSIRDSPVRLPVTFANEIYSHPELGMGLRFFQLILSDDTALDCQTGETVDFLAWPEGVQPGDVTAIKYAVGAGRTNPTIGVAPYSWCLYEE